MDPKSWHYQLWKWCVMTGEKRSFTPPTKVMVYEYWLTICCAPFIAMLWVGLRLLSIMRLLFILGMFALINACTVPFGLVLGLKTGEFRYYRPLFRIYRQKIYPIHLVCSVFVLAGFIGLNFALTRTPEHQQSSWLFNVTIGVAFNALYLMVVMAWLSTQRLGKRLEAYVRLRYRQLPAYTFDREPTTEPTT